MNTLPEILSAAWEFVRTGADVSWVNKFAALGKAYISGVESDINFIPERKGLKEVLQNKIISAKSAAKMIKPRSVVISCGFGSMARPSVFFRALKSIAAQRNPPLRLTWITVSAAGARGRAEGSLEDLAHPHLIDCYITGHVETVKAFVPLVETGKMEWHTLPQGVITQILENQKRKIDFVETVSGLGTFLEDLACGDKNAFVSKVADKLRYRLPFVDTALIVAAKADAEGNLSMKDAATLTEMADAARAAKANGGIVIAIVGKIVDSFEEEKFLLANEVDYIIVDPYAEQIAGIPLNNAWTLFRPQSPSENSYKVKEAYEAMRLVNKVASITSNRNEAGEIIARLAAKTLAENASAQALVNIGVGLPEEVAGIFCEQDIYTSVVFSVEGGALGGVPAPGVFFGTSIYPTGLESSTATFARYRKNLDAAILGFLQIDAEGSVNVSRRGDKNSAASAIGPGGFIDICEAAKLIIFVGLSRVRGKIKINNGRVKILPNGKMKLVPKLDEKTFDGKRALALGKKVFYITDFGLLRLTESGLLLEQVFEGVDVVHDIERVQLIPIQVAKNLKLVEKSVVTGGGFKIKLS
ncbi:MAG: Caffeate CoA-transferase [Turneriella sp.]|nr:Caffeate CoA-transferase [Turneriella sp.]